MRSIRNEKKQNTRRSILKSCRKLLKFKRSERSTSVELLERRLAELAQNEESVAKEERIYQDAFTNFIRKTLVRAAPRENQTKRFRLYKEFLCGDDVTTDKVF
jgi:hypothetical protein